MIITKEIYNTYLEILNEELTTAFGCTEPIAIAYCSALARKLLGRLPEHVIIEASGNIIKNVKSVIVPNTNGLKGIPAAAAAGIVAGQADRELEVIADVDAAQKKTIKEFLDTAEFEVKAMEDGDKLDIRITVESGGDSAVVRISGTHTNVVYTARNGAAVECTEETAGENAFQKGNSGKSTCSNSTSHKSDRKADRSLLTVENIVAFADKLNPSDVEALLERQISLNTAIAQEGIRNNWGANVGSVLLKVYGEDVRNRAKAMAAAGSDARMSGCELPVVINSGSGNQGITVSLPIIEYAREFGKTRDELYRALVVSNLIAIHIKTGIGPLSAFCGAVSAGCAAGCGIAYLLGGKVREVAHTLVNSLAIVSGIVCDGAKPSCAGKIAASVDAGILGYEMFMQGQQFYAEEGLVSKGVEATIRNICRLGARGMSETDEEIIRIMTHCD